MSEAVLSVEKREGSGKSVVRKLRRADKVPGTIYGGADEPASISVDALEIARLLRGEHSIVDIEVDGKAEQVVVKDVQKHPVYSQIIHIDFMRVVAGQEIAIEVPIHLVGEAIGVKNGGVLTTLRSEVQISVLPKNMPDNIEVDISNLEIGDAIRLGDLKSENFTIIDDDNEMVAQVSAQKMEEEEPEDILAEEEESAEPEVITAKDDEEDKDE
jgi:large subunit ribosomal protein L25